MAGKLPPHDIDAEENVTGAILISPESVKDVATWLRPADFYSDANRDVYEAALNVYHRRETPTQITVAQELDRLGKLESVGGAAYLSHLVSICVSSLDIVDHAKIVRRLAAHRRVISAAGQIERLGYEANPDINKTLAAAQAHLDSLRREYAQVDDTLITPAMSGTEILDLMTEYNEPKSRMRWGFNGLDDLTAGLYPGELVIVAGRPATGKSQLMLEAANYIAHSGKTVLWASVEMGSRGLNERRIAAAIGDSVKWIRAHGITDMNKQDKVVMLSGTVSETPLYFLRSGISSDTVINAAHRMRDTVGLDAIFIDYLQKLADCYAERENQNIRVGRVCNKLKQLALELEVPVVLASQLNRASEYRANPRPLLEDLRDSGNIEQDADVVLLLYRDHDNQNLDIVHTLEVKLAKGRQLDYSRPIEMIYQEETRRYDSDFYRKFSLNENGKKAY